MQYYAQSGIEVQIDGQDVAVAIGHHGQDGYVPSQTYSVRVAPGYQYLTPFRVAEALRSALEMADARHETFDLRSACRQIAAANLAGPWAIKVPRD